MTPPTTFLLRRSHVLLIACLVPCCRRSEPDAGKPAEGTRPAAAQSARAAPRSPASTELVETAQPDAGLDGFIDSGMYKFKFDGLKSCAPETAPAANAKPQARRIGVWMQVAAAVDNFFVSGRDLELETGGVILASAMVDANKPGSADDPCTPPFPARNLFARQRSAGVVVFEIPPGFNTENKPVSLRYKPTRWGGARVTTIELPACLETCPDGAVPLPPTATKAPAKATKAKADKRKQPR